MKSVPDTLMYDRLAEGLEWLCAETGALMHPLRAAEPSGVLAVLDDEVEEAAREAYQRDYMGFGFGPRGKGQAA